MSRPDVVTHERNGLIVPAGDVDALAAAVNRLLRGGRPRAARIGEPARTTLGDSFSADQMVDRTIAVYESVRCQREARRRAPQELLENLDGRAVAGAVVSGPLPNGIGNRTGLSCCAVAA